MNASSCIAVAVLLLGAASASAQTAQTAPGHVPLPKVIGQAKPEIVPSLIVINARGATLQGGKLALSGVAPNSIVFADRPVRAAGHSLTSDLLQEWAPGNDSDESFAEDPPNATVSVFSQDGAKVRDAVVVLKTAKLEGDRLTFDVEVLEGELTGADGPAALFIDRFGYGGFRGGYARVGGGGVAVGRVGAVGGVWRRPYVARGAWYRGAGVGAAVVGGAAIGAAAASAYNSPACGYYPYPPCY
jgi:hypothetical protein